VNHREAIEGYDCAVRRIVELLENAVDLYSLPAGVGLFHEDGAWFCECESLDYFSQGDTPQGAVRTFRVGLQATILANLEHHGRFAPTPRGSLETWLRGDRSRS
jgi:hypothetical protein